jgi:hypothetical protein
VVAGDSDRITNREISEVPEAELRSGRLEIDGALLTRKDALRATDRQETSP